MSEAKLPALPGIERAAIFLMAVGEAGAAEVLKHMGPKEVQRVGQTMASLQNVSAAQVEQVIDEFVGTLNAQTALGIDSDEYIRKVLTDALGADKAAGMIDRILLGRNSKGLEQLKWLEGRAVAELIRNEHPQIIAIVLSYLDSDQAAEVLQQLPERTRADVIMRIATLDGVQPAALQELDEILEKQLSGGSSVQSSAIGGVKVAANILNMVDGTIEGKIMESLRNSDADTAQKIQDKMFVFENLLDVDDRGIQTLLREVQTDSLLLALKGADEALKEKIFANMSKRAAEMLRDDLEAKGPVRLSEVEAAQKEILSVARRLSDAGEIALGGSGGEEFI